MGRDLSILQVVGFKDSGKTTLIESVLFACRQKGHKAGVIKHHGHGELDSHDHQKDTGRFRQSGAVVTGISAGNELEMQLVNDSEWHLQQIVHLYRYLPLDVLLIEGFKREAYPKIVMVKQAEDFEAFQELENIQAVVTWDRQLKGAVGFPVFHISEQERYLPWILSKWGGKPGE